MLITSLPVAEGLASIARHHSFIHVPATPLDVNLSLPSYTIYWVIDGSLTARVDGATIPLPSRSMLVANPNQTVSVRQSADRGSRLMIINVTQTALGQAHDELKRATRNLFSTGSALQSWPVEFSNRSRSQDSYLSPVLQRIKDAVDLGTEDNIWLDGQLGVLGERLLLAEHRRIMNASELGHRRGSLSGRLIKVRDYIDQRYQQPLRLEHMARVVYASPYHFLRMFKEAYGQTPHQYLIQRRLDASRDLLETTSLRISEISERVGFQNANGFYKAFKRRYDCSPAAFRESGR